MLIPQDGTPVDFEAASFDLRLPRQKLRLGAGAANDRSAGLPQLTNNVDKLWTGNALADLCDFLRKGQTVCLHGSAGAGKTRFLTDMIEKNLSAVDGEDAETTHVVVVCEKKRSYRAYQRMLNKLDSDTAERVTLLMFDAEGPAAGEQAWLTLLRGVGVASAGKEDPAVTSMKHTVLVLDDVCRFEAVANPSGYHSVTQCLFGAM